MASIVAPIVLEAVAYVFSLLHVPHKLLRVFNVPVKGLQRWVPVFGGKSLPEISFMIASFLIILVSGFSVGGIGVGKIADVIGAIVLLFGLRGAVMRKVLRPEVVLFWHKFLAFIMLMLLLIHCIQVGLSTTGLVMAIVTLSMPLVFFAYKFSDFKFIWFYWHHIISIMVFIPVAFLHGATGIGWMGIAWYLDVLQRYLFSARTGTAQIVRVSDNISYVEVAVISKKPLFHVSGQHYFINIPIVSYLEFHPFSVIPVQTISKSGKTSVEDLQHICFYIRRGGSWTSQLYSLGSDSSTRDGEDTLGATNFPVRLEGPYGNISIDYSNHDVYPTLVLIAGGVGVTPILSILTDLVQKKNMNQKVIFIWAVNDADFAQDVNQRVLKPLLRHTQLTTINTLHLQQEKKNIINNYEEDDMERNEEDSIMNRKTSSGISLDLQFFYTGSNNDSSQAVHIMKRQGWQLHRPNLSNILHGCINQTSSISGISSRAGVVVCGPESMIEKVRDICAQEVFFSKDSGIKITVDVHEEFFHK